MKVTHLKSWLEGCGSKLLFTILLDVGLPMTGLSWDLYNERKPIWETICWKVRNQNLDSAEDKDPIKHNWQKKRKKKEKKINVMILC